MTLRWIIALYALWLLLLFAVIAAAIARLPYVPTFPYHSDWLPEYGERWITTFAHFDGVHYLTIIRNGYVGTGLIQAFFPFYPLLVKVVSLSLLNPIIVGVIISVLSTLIAVHFLNKLYPKFSKRILLLLFSFPTAFYLIMLYTEGLFLLLSIGSYYFAKKNNWILGSLIGFLTGLTRLQGVLVTILLLVEARKQNLGWKNYVLALSPLFGLSLYMAYLWITFGDPLLFVTVQDDFGAQRASGMLIPILTPLVRYVRILVTVPFWSHAYYIAVQELLFTLGGTWLAYRLMRKKEYSFALYSASSILLPTLTGSLSSMPRYVLVIFPLLIELTRTLKGKWFYMVVLIFAILQIINLMLFTQGKWVA